MAKKRRGPTPRRRPESLVPEKTRAELFDNASQLAEHLSIANAALLKLARPAHFPRSEEATLLQSEVAWIAEQALDAQVDHYEGRAA